MFAVIYLIAFSINYYYRKNKAFFKIVMQHFMLLNFVVASRYPIFYWLVILTVRYFLLFFLFLKRIVIYLRSEINNKDINFYYS